MRCKEARELQKQLLLTYDPATRERYDRTHKSLFPRVGDQSEQPSESHPEQTGATPATISQIRHVLYDRQDDV